jgi:two-component system OmpR family response regulator
VIVLDVTLPDMDGFEVASRLSAEHAEVPILFLSARDATADKVRGLTTGGDDYVTKPFSLEELIARLRNILRRTGVVRQSSGRLRFSDLEHVRGVEGRPCDRAYGDGVSVAAVSHAQPSARAHARAAS